MTSEGSCDNEAWSNDPENSALIRGKKYIILKKRKEFQNSIK